MTPGQRLDLEEAAARAWPPHEEAALDGWQMRFSGGGSQRANSVQTLRWTGEDVEAAIDAAERAYRARGLTPMFQVLDISLPHDLDHRLAARGYTAIDRTLMMTKAVAPSPPASKFPVIRQGDPTPAWLDIYLGVVTPDRRATAPAIIAALPRPRCFFLAEHEGEPFAVGLGMAEGPYCGIECMATREGGRRLGGARAVLDALECWAAEQAATTLWLQVLETNVPARRLYRSLGFEIAGAYGYRHAPKA